MERRNSDGREATIESGHNDAYSARGQERETPGREHTCSRERLMIAETAVEQTT